MENQCRHFSEELTALAFGELEGPALELVKAHLEGCASCRKEMQSIRDLLARAEGLPRLAVSKGLHARIMESVRVEREVQRLSAGERLRMAADFMGYQLKRSGTARFLFFAAAAQIFVLLALYLASGVKVQDMNHANQDDAGKAAKGEGRFMVPTAQEEEERFVLGPGADWRPSDPSRWTFDPPTKRIPPPRVEVEEEIPDILVENLDRRIDRENRLELSRYRMYARFSVRCKNRVLEGRGGDRRTDYAVERGLQWLRAHQREDGSWHPSGPFGGDVRTRVGITALCVAAFLSDGHSQMNGRYSETVNNAINYLLASQDGKGRFGWYPDDRGISLFNQSTTVLVLAENFILCGGRHESSLTKGLEGLIAMTEESEKEDGPSPLGQYSDTWAAMALRTSAMTGIEVPRLRESAARAEEKVALLARDEIKAGPAAFATIPPVYTASEVALDALFQEDSAPAGPGRVPFPDLDRPETLFHLLEDPDFREPSFLFFIGTALCEYGDDLWTDWNGKVKSILLEEQQRDGLWPVDGDWPWIDGGDIYTTALHLLTLQVYYRYIKLEENCN